MSKLDAADRKALPAADFAGPNRSYPVPDRNHAVAAKAMATRFAAPAVKAKVDAKANQVLGSSERGHVTHNPANQLPQHAMHARGRGRGMGSY